MLLFIAQALLDRDQAAARPDDIHIWARPVLGIKDGWDTAAVMHCGAVVLFADDASLIPKGFDFVVPPNVGNATCEVCKRGYAAGARNS